MTRRAAVDAPAAETVAVSVVVVATAEVATAVATVVEAVTGAAAVEIASRGSKNLNPCGDWNLRKGSFFVAAKLLL